MASLDLADGPTVVFSAHGVPPSTHHRARELGLDVLDTTCAFVVDIHDEVERALSEGCHLVFVGDLRQAGLMVGIEIVADRASKRGFPYVTQVGYVVAAEARARGLLVRPIGGPI